MHGVKYLKKMVDKKNMNQFDFIRSEQRGCRDGVHMPDEEMGNIGIEKNGDLTMLIFRCLVCKQTYGVAAPLGLNEYIDDKPRILEEIPAQVAPSTQEINNQSTSVDSRETELRSEVQKKLFNS